jgi:hypothetical protein
MHWCWKQEESEGGSTVLKSWNISAVATVVLPLFIFMIARLVNRDNNGGRRRLWWWGGEGQPEGEGGSGALFFVYIWSLLLFAYLVWYGNRVLSKEKENQIQVLLAALFVFANLAFLCSILMGSLGFEGAGAEGWMVQWPAVMVLTYVLWTIFAGLFAGILYRKTRKGKTSSLDDYQRQDDDGIF